MSANPFSGSRNVPSHARKSLAWRLNWYRQSELDGALLLGQAVERAHDGYLISRLTQHCSDEARHACLWERAIVRLDLPSVRILRSYQSFCLEKCVQPLDISEALAFTHVVERRAQQQFLAELRRPSLLPVVHRVLTALLRSEQAHLDWVSRWLAARPEGEQLLARYGKIDTRVYNQLSMFGDRLWDVPGLGEELAP